jgi:hypothetical protein
MISFTTGTTAMNMTKKGYIFTSEYSGENKFVMASSLAEATGKLLDSFQWDDYYIDELYHIAKMSDCGNWQILESFWDYDAADRKIDRYSNKFSGAYVEIIRNNQPVD